MLVNFTQEQIVLTKSTVLGIAEEVSPCVAAAINDDVPGSQPCHKQLNDEHQHVNTVARNAKYKQYLDGVLRHQTKQERDVLEPVLQNFQHVFHDDEHTEFKGKDLVEHRIRTGDARPIRKARHRVPYALRDEMERQVKDMLNKEVIEPSSSPWSAQAVLVPKKTTDGSPKYRFWVDFRALNKVSQFDTYSRPIFDETISPFHGSRYFSVLDCYAGFWQLRLAEENKMRTVFSVPCEHYQFLRPPYGISH
jgi:hypothetical protein